MTHQGTGSARKRPPLGVLLRDTQACPGARRWAAKYGAQWDKAWRECDRADWLLWIAHRVGVRERVVYAAARAACPGIDPDYYGDWWNDHRDHRPAGVDSADASAVRKRIAYADVIAAAKARGWT